MSDNHKAVTVNHCTIELVRGDITNQNLEAVVNAANKELAPGGGVAGAIHRAAGSELWEECKELGGCETGEAKLTKGYNLPADYIIHTVGPVYSASPEDAQFLRRSYKNSLKLAIDNEIRDLAFPALSTGAFGYPMEDAAPIALATIKDFLQKQAAPNLVRMVLHGEDSYRIHEQALRNLTIS